MGSAPNFFTRATKSATRASRFSSDFSFADGTNQRVFRAAKQIGVGGLDAGNFFSGHRMAAQKTRAAFVKRVCGHRAHRTLRAAGIRDQRVGRGQPRDFRQQLDRVSYGKRHVNQIRAGNCSREIGNRFLDRAAFTRLLQHVRFIPADDGRVRGGFAECEGERAADQSRAQDRDAAEGGGHA